MWIWGPVIFLLFLHCGPIILAEFFPPNYQLYEGNRCKLANGAGEGVCVKAIDCPERIRQVFWGEYNAVGRCGFDKFDEIYCCEGRPVSRLNDEVRRAEVACQNYKKMFKELGLDGYVHTEVFSDVLAKQGDFPHMAALKYSVPEEEAAGGATYVCGGTLISQRHVLTAAHCVNNVQGLVPVDVVLGTSDLGGTLSQGSQRIRISRIIKHPEHKRSLNYHDVAVLELQDPVKFTIDVFPTCLMTEPLSRETLDAGTSLVVLGWGAIYPESTTSMKLLKAERLKLVNKKSCCKTYSHTRARIPNGLDDAMICVRDPDNTRRADTCWGDSGGPLLVSAPVFPRLIGVTSFGQACGGTAPGVYASVYKYLDWIEDQVWAN